MPLIIACIMVVLPMVAQQVFVVKKGDAQDLLDVIDKVNRLNATPQAERTFILIPDGYYDLKEKTLTRILGNNVALVGQSMEGTIIRNAPDV